MEIHRREKFGESGKISEEGIQKVGQLRFYSQIVKKMRIGVPRTIRGVKLAPEVWKFINKKKLVRVKKSEESKRILKLYLSSSSIK